jgi:ubiquinone/menaquinone biosynthesis C-methylase UbiE
MSKDKITLDPTLVQGYKDAYRRMFGGIQLVLEKIAHASVASIGCGTALDAEAQAYFVLENMVKDGGLMNFTGIDIEASYIETAKRVIRNDYGKRVNYNFLAQDAANVDKVLRDGLDAVFVSHPDVRRDPWKEIIGAATKVHKKGGILVATFAHGYELDELIRAIEDGYKILRTGHERSNIFLVAQRN